MEHVTVLQHTGYLNTLPILTLAPRLIPVAFIPLLLSGVVVLWLWRAAENRLVYDCTSAVDVVFRFFKSEYSKIKSLYPANIALLTATQVRDYQVRGFVMTHHI